MKIFINLFIIVFMFGCDSNPPDFNLSKNCDLILGCPTDEMSEHLTVNVPKNISPEQLFDLELTFNSPVQKVDAKLEGITMYMGVIPVFFKQQGDLNSFRATTLVGRCATDTMQWRLTLYWQQGNQNFKAYKVIDIKLI